MSSVPSRIRFARLRDGLRSAVPPLLASTVVLGCWQVVSTFELVPPDMLPSPVRIVSAGFGERQALWRHTLPTLRATLLGFSLSVSTAFLLATLLDFFAPLRRALFPLLIMSQTLPLIALAPLVVLWFGFGLLPKVLLVAFVTFFPMVVGFLRGFGSADPEAEHLLRSTGAGRFQVFRLVRLPSSTVFFFSALRISVTYAVVGAIFAEYAGAVRGLGVYMQSSKNVFRTDLVLAAVLVSTVLTLSLYGVVVLIERVALPWLRPDSATVARPEAKRGWLPGGVSATAPVSSGQVSAPVGSGASGAESTHLGSDRVRR